MPLEEKMRTRSLLVHLPCAKGIYVQIIITDELKLVKFGLVTLRRRQSLTQCVRHECKIDMF